MESGDGVVESGVGESGVGVVESGVGIVESGVGVVEADVFRWSWSRNSSLEMELEFNLVMFDSYK